MPHSRAVRARLHDPARNPAPSTTPRDVATSRQSPGPEHGRDQAVLAAQRENRRLPGKRDCALVGSIPRDSMPPTRNGNRECCKKCLTPPRIHHTAHLDRWHGRADARRRLNERRQLFRLYVRQSQPCRHSLRVLGRHTTKCRKANCAAALRRVLEAAARDVPALARGPAAEPSSRAHTSPARPRPRAVRATFQQLRADALGGEALQSFAQSHRRPRAPQHRSAPPAYSAVKRKKRRMRR